VNIKPVNNRVKYSPYGTWEIVPQRQNSEVFCMKNFRKQMQGKLKPLKGINGESSETYVASDDIYPLEVCKNTLVLSVNFNLLHSFRVYFLCY
jgi:hypothetical protein